MTVDRAAFLYTPYYCEENIWHLCQAVAAPASKCVFISNPLRQCFFWQQRACPDENMPMCWDYHVVLLARDAEWKIWDLDTRLPLPMNASDYLSGTFAYVGRGEPDYDPKFRLVDAEDFVRQFSSDRSHMLDADGRWMQPPPDWQCIGESRENNLQKFIDMHDTTYGIIMGLGELRSFLRR